MLKTLALVLKKQNLGEADRILTILTPAHGRKRVVARAVRKPLSKLAGHLDSMMVSQIIITDKPDLPNVTSAVLVESFENIRESLPLLEQSYAVGKLAEKLAADDAPQQTLFQATLDAFVRVNDSRNWPATWLFYLSKLCRLYGVYISQFDCAGCGKPLDGAAVFDPAERLLYHPEHVLGTKTSPMSANSVKLLKLLTKESYEMIERIRIPAQVASEIEAVLLYELIENYLGDSWKKYARLA